MLRRVIDKEDKNERYINNKNLTKCSEKIMGINFDEVKIRSSKHFILTWMRKWNWDIYDIRNALQRNYKIEKVGRNKYEVYIHSKYGSKKLIFILDEELNEIFIITGSEGK